MEAVIDLSLHSEYGLYIWTGILTAVIVGIAFPVAYYQEKEKVSFRSHEEKVSGDILVPVFSGFLFQGHFTYVCVDSQQDKRLVAYSINRAREFCLDRNSWHFDWISGRFYAWHHRRRAIKAPNGS